MSSSRKVDLGERLRYAWETLVGRGKSSGGPPGTFAPSTSFMSGPLSIDSWGVKPAPTPWELVEAFKSVSYFCANTNANAVATVPLRLYVHSGRGNSKPRDIADPRSVTRSMFRSLQKRGLVSGTAEVEDIHEIRNHPLLDVLRKPDNEPDGFDQYALIHTICRYNDVVGTCYIWPNYPGKKRPPTELWTLFSQYVRPIRNSGKAPIDAYSYFDETFKKGDLLVFKNYKSLRDPYGPGYSPTYAAMEYLKLEDRFVGVQDQLLSMGPRPNLLASPKDPNMPIGRDEKDAFQADLNRRHARAAQGGVLVVNGSWDITPISYSPTDLAGLKVAEYDLERACSAYDCPIEFFTPDTNLANLQAAERKHATRGVNPRCHGIAARFTRLAQQYDDRLFFAFDNADPTDEEREAKIWDIRVKNNSATINQANADTGLPPVPWGEKPWMPSNVATPDMLEKAHEQSMKTLAAGAAGLAKGGNPNKVGKKTGKGGDVGRPKNPKKARSVENANLDANANETELQVIQTFLGLLRKSNENLDRDRNPVQPDRVRGDGGDHHPSVPAVHGSEGLTDGPDGRSGVPDLARPGQHGLDLADAEARSQEILDESLENSDEGEDENRRPFGVADLAELPEDRWREIESQAASIIDTLPPS